MNANKLAPFAGQKYISLETYRKNGQAVRTPVWFAENDGRLYIYTLADAGKAKRLRNNPRARIAPCDMRGRVNGEWSEAEARFVQGEEAAKANVLLNRKYWLKRFFNLTSKLRRTPRVIIAIKPV
jgi:PPOX class probable F420-dependent enzyme